MPRVSKKASPSTSVTTPVKKSRVSKTTAKSEPKKVDTLKNITVPQYPIYLSVNEFASSDDSQYNYFCIAPVSPSHIKHTGYIAILPTPFANTDFRYVDTMIAADSAKAFDITFDSSGLGSVVVRPNLDSTSELLKFDEGTKTDDPAKDIMRGIRVLHKVDKDSVYENFNSCDFIENIQSTISYQELQNSLVWLDGVGLCIKTQASAQSMQTLTKSRGTIETYKLFNEQAVPGQAIIYDAKESPGNKVIMPPTGAFYSFIWAAAKEALYKSLSSENSETSIAFGYLKQKFQTNSLYQICKKHLSEDKSISFSEPSDLEHVLPQLGFYGISESLIYAVNKKLVQQDTNAKFVRCTPTSATEIRKDGSTSINCSVILDKKEVDLSFDDFKDAVLEYSSEIHRLDVEDRFSEILQNKIAELRQKGGIYSKLLSIKKPNVEEDKFFVQEDVWLRLLRNFHNKKPTLLIGDTGSGKTSLAYEMSKRLKVDLYYEDMANMEDPVSSLVGMLRLKDGSSYFDPAPFARAIQKPQIIVLDEINRCRPRATNMLFSCLDFRRQLSVNFAESQFESKIEVNKDCFFIATANVGAGYSGVDSIDEALSNRFDVIQLEYPDDKSLFSIMRSKFPAITDMEHKKIEDYVSALKDFVQDKNLRVRLSITFFQDLYSLVNDGFPKRFVSQKVSSLNKSKNKVFQDFIESSENLLP